MDAVVKKEADIVKELRLHDKVSYLYKSKENVELIHNDNAEEKQDVHTQIDEDYPIDKNQDNLSPESIPVIELSKEIQEMLFQNTNDIMAYLDLRGHIVKINKTVETFTGYSEQDVVGKVFWKIPGLLPEKFYSIALKAFKNILFGTDLKDFSVIFYDKNKKKHKINLSTYRIKENNKVKYFLVIGKDITQDEENLEKFRNLVERANDGILILKDTIVQYANPRLAELWGGTTKEVIGTSFMHYIDPDELPRITELYQQRLAGKPVPNFYETVLRRKDGKKIYAQLNAGIIPFEGTTADFVIVHDITEQKQYAKILRDSQQRLADVINFLPDATFVIDTTGKVLIWNHAVELITGVKSEDIVGKANYEYSIPFYGERRPILIDLAFESIETINIKYRWIKHDKDILIAEAFCPNLKPHGRYMWGLTKKLYDSNGTLIGAIESIRDVAEEKLAQDALKQSEEKLKNIVEHSNEMFYIHNKNNIFSYLSPQSYKIIGYTVEEIKFEWTKLLTDNPINKNAERLTQQALKTGQKQPPYLIEVYHKNKNKILLEADESPLKDNNGMVVGLVGAARDVTVQHHAQEIVQKTVDHLKKLEFIVNHSGAVAFLWRATEGWPVEFVSPNISQFGYMPDDFISGKIPYASFIHKDDLAQISEDVANFSKKGVDEFTQQYRIYTKTGELRWIEDRTWVRRDTAGKITHYQGIVFDITQRKTMEQALQESEKRYRLLVDNAEFPVVVTSISEGRILFYNRQAKIFFEGTDEDNKDTVHVNDFWVRPAEREVFAKELASKGRVTNYECELKSKKGAIRWVIVSANVIIYDNQPAAFLIYNDITERKKMEQEVRRSKNELENILHAAADGIRVVGTDFKVKSLNLTMARLSGIAIDTGIGMHCKDMFGADNICGTDQCSLIQVLKTGKSFQREVHRKTTNGQELIYLQLASPYKDTNGNIIGVIEDFRDITHIKKAEKNLEESEQRYRSLFHDAHDMIQSVDLQGHFQFVNPAWKTILGYSDEDLSTLLLMDVIHPNSLPHCLDFFSRILGGEKLDKLEAKFLTKQGKTLFVEGHASPRYVDGKIVGTQGIFRDITEQKLAEGALRKSEKRFRDLAELLPESIFEADLRGRITYGNKKAFETFGYDSEDIEKGLTFDQLIAPEYLQKIKQNYNGILSGENTRGNEYVFIKKDGTRISMLIYSVPIYESNNVVGLRGVAMDITMLKEAYNEIENLLKIKDDFINQLGHDLKTPLSPLVNLLPLILENEQDPRSKERLKIAISCVEYMKDLVVKTIELAKLNSNKMLFDFENVDLTSLIQTILIRDKHLFEEKHITVENLIVEPVYVAVDKLRIEEVITNLLSNAVKYIENSHGIITLRSKKNQKNIIISIKDNGIGLREDQLELIFNEFYKGDLSRHELESSGLGLSICKRIVEKHGGKIWAESPGLGKGTTIFFSLSITTKKDT